MRKTPEKTYFNWSTGKDSAFALYHILKDDTYAVDKLLTTINTTYDRVSMHGLRTSLLKAQAKALGIALDTVSLSATVSMQSYTQIMQEKTTALVKQGYTKTVFGDIFLEDLRTYRENALAVVGIQAVFPLWKKDTKVLLQDFLDLGFKAITVCVNARYLSKDFVGRVIDASFIADLPDGVDPCGENGEFHTFVFDGPIFKHPVDFIIAEKVLRTTESAKQDTTDNKADTCFSTDTKNTWDTAFWYCDLLPKP